jgi:hypothetical protein
MKAFSIGISCPTLLKQAKKDEQLAPSPATPRVQLRKGKYLNAHARTTFSGSVSAATSVTSSGLSTSSNMANDASPAFAHHSSYLNADPYAWESQQNCDVKRSWKGAM